jgi:hypothetical protein
MGRGRGRLGLFLADSSINQARKLATLHDVSIFQSSVREALIELSTIQGNEVCLFTNAQA